LPWSAAELERMNARFVERVERAIADGDEQPQMCWMRKAGSLSGRI
jgi:hypothetical protein